MKRMKEIFSEELLQKKRHPVMQKLMAVLLCVCLLMVSLPMEFYGSRVLAEEAQKKIMSFSQLPEEVKNQVVDFGTTLEELNLPDKLTVTCIQAVNAMDIGNSDQVEASPQGKGAALEEGPLQEEPSEEYQELSENTGGSEEDRDVMENPEEELSEENKDISEINEEDSIEDNPGAAEDPSETVMESPVPEPEKDSTSNTESETEPSTYTEEAVEIGSITWISAPEYDGGTEGVYAFTPVIPESYVLSEGVELPEISVAVKNKNEIIEEDGEEGQNQEKEGKKSREAERKKSEEKRNMSEELGEGRAEWQELFASSSEPSCGIISEDTVWNKGTLNTGELVVEPGVTLTLNDNLTIGGDVTIRGGGTIVRGNTSVEITVYGRTSSLTMKDITLDGRELASNYPMITVNNGKIMLDDGCRIQNCKNINSSFLEGGGAINLKYATAILNDAVIENCSAYGRGGAIFLNESKITINGGAYINNKTITEQAEYGCGGGFIYNLSSELYIYGGHFIGNTTVGRGGAIYHTGVLGTKTYLYGGIFEGNTCSWDIYAGSGAIWNSSVSTDETYFEISSNVKFCGDGTDSGVDGIYLDSRNSIPRKINISNTLSYPVTLYVKAVEGYIIAKGVNEYRLLHNRDMKRIHFVDIGDSGKKWYAVLENNQVKITENNPEYGCFVYYISNGAEGTVVDDEEYEIGDITKVKPADELKREDYTFLEWNTQADGGGVSYQPGDELEINGDVDLYAIFLENGKKTLTANFYSGSACEKETQCVTVDETQENVDMEVPELKEMEGWTPVGWERGNSSRYVGEVKPKENITLTEDADYYGIYKKSVTLSYDADGAEGEPEPETKERRANVHEEIAYQDAEFTVASGPTKKGYNFVGWKTGGEGREAYYQPGDTLKIEEDTTLYAVFEEREKKTLLANFYSGGAGQKKTESAVVDLDATEGIVSALKLEDMPGWTALGWSESEMGYECGVMEGEECTLTELVTEYYGIYRKDVTLSYDADGAEGEPEPETKERRANVHEEIAYQDAEFTVAPGLNRDGFNFIGWKLLDGEGEAYYQPGDILKIEEDTTLCAVFEEREKRTFLADFYSGGAGLKETVTETVDAAIPSVSVMAPSLREMEGWEPVGWSRDESSYEGKIEPGSELALEVEYNSYYGIYRRGVTLSYDANGGGDVPEAETRLRYANLHGGISYKDPEVTIAEAPVREGYAFRGWNEKPDGTGAIYVEGDGISLSGDMTLYAVWEEDPDVVNYRVEHYCQDLEGDGYARIDSDTEILTGVKGTEVTARPKKYTGFTVDLSNPLGKASGTVEGDGSLALKFYYDRDVYEVEFNLNGGYGTVPETQKVRYGGLLEPVNDPARRGYSFKGWHMDDSGLDGGLWDFEGTVESNTGTLHTTLYAKWEDELAPAMGEASFGKGHKNFLDWVIGKKSLSITVPVTEEGSGLAKAEYLLVSEDGTEKEGLAQIVETHALSENAAAHGIGNLVVRAAQGEEERGTYEAGILVDEEFKGQVFLTCTDHAGNVSAQKTLTSSGGGAIVESNAPEITFANTKETVGKPVKVEVSVRDGKDGDVSAGIAGISYRLDKGKEVALPEGDFSHGIVETYEFTVKASGEGEHALRVFAKDRAGNESEGRVTLKINGKKEIPAPAQETPRGMEPRTGEGAHVKVYATVAMIAGFSYLLLYFEGEHGMTEQEKEEVVYRLVEWAKRGGKLRRMLGLVVISLFLAYYHSIGKSVTVEWREVCAEGTRKNSGF